MTFPKIIVTGGLGYIGSHTCVELIHSGYEVIIADNLSNADISVLDGIHSITGIKPRFIQVDLSDSDSTLTFFNGFKDIAGIIHFAAFKAVGKSVQFPLKYYKNNVGSMINIVYNMLELGISNLIFSSSCTVYGQPDQLPVSESSPIQAAWSPYGNTKQICEEILNDVCSSQNRFNGIALRYFNPIGAHESALIGELPLGTPNNLMPFITQTAIGLRSELKVFGSDYNTPDGTAIRDYLHVVDLAKAHVTALERLLKKENTSNNEFYNLGTGKGSSVLEVIQSFEKTSGTSLNYVMAERRPGDVEAVYADTTKAKEILGWETELSLDDMTRSAWKWEQALKARS